MSVCLRVFVLAICAVHRRHSGAAAPVRAVGRGDPRRVPNGGEEEEGDDEDDEQAEGASTLHRRHSDGGVADDDEEEEEDEAERESWARQRAGIKIEGKRI